MHSHIEIIMPPIESSDEIASIIDRVMRHFQEEDEEGDRNPNGWWDFYVIGGRWSGQKLKDSLDQEKLEQFTKELEERKFTVSGVRAGKPELAPSDQIPLVDALWKEYFPDWAREHCPLFKHYDNQYAHSLGGDNVMRVDEISEDIGADKVLIAAEQYNGEIGPEFLVQREIWNGTWHEKTAWDGTVKGALELYEDRISRMREDALERVAVRPDWLTVTVDIHS